MNQSVVVTKNALPKIQGSATKSSCGSALRDAVRAMVSAMSDALEGGWTSITYALLCLSYLCSRSLSLKFTLSVIKVKLVQGHPVGHQAACGQESVFLDSCLVFDTQHHRLDLRGAGGCQLLVRAFFLFFHTAA